MNFKKEFLQEVDNTKPNWIVNGFITNDDKIYTLGTDTKVLSKTFELISYPIIKKVATKFNLKVIESPYQTVYPDFTLCKKEDSKEKIAVDIKSTYLRIVNGVIRPFSFTLGSYTSFIRNNTKNIVYPYDTYKQHWIIGFVYKRADNTNITVVDLKNRKKIKPSYNSVAFFVQEKYKIAGESPGSGNTANIGSFKSSRIEDFDRGLGPFYKLGERIFIEYWANYSRFSPRGYVNLKQFFEWKKRNIKKVKKIS